MHSTRGTCVGHTNERVDILVTKKLFRFYHKSPMPLEMSYQWLVVQASLSKIIVFQEDKLQVMKIQSKQGTFPQNGYYGNMSSPTVIKTPEVLPR